MLGEEGEGRRNGVEGDRKRERKSQDRIINKEGKTLINFIEERGWGILNGCTKGDEMGEFTFTGGRGGSVIDYVIGNEELREEVEKMRIGENIDSDHQPVEVWIGGEKEENSGREKRREERKGGYRGTWNKEGCEEFRKRLGKVEYEGKEIEVEMERMEEKIRGSLKEWERDRKGAKEERKKGWWDRDCAVMKKKVREELRKWKRWRRGGEEYKRVKRDYKELCESKKKEENDRWERKAKVIRREGDVWEIIKYERTKKNGMVEGIEMEEWRRYFMGLLGGVEMKAVMGEGRKTRDIEEKEISRKEIKEAMKRIKEGKATGGEGIPGEAWKYGGVEVEEWIWNLCNDIWKGKGWPEGWKEGIIIPIVKKGEGERVEHYRGVTVMSALYKVYVSVLLRRLEEEVEEKEIIPENQAGFRKGRGTIDNIFILNYLINRQVGRKKGGMVAMFVDLKAAFDSVDRKVLLNTMREKGIREGLIERVEEVLRETKSRVRIGGELGEGFWTVRGLRQGCPLSPLLFNILIADIEEEMKKVKWGGVKLGEGRVYSLAYADDVVLMAEKEEEMRSMMERWERYVGTKNLEVNVEKTKIMRFRRKGGRWKSIVWKWKGKTIGEVKEFKYLGYTFQRNGGQEAHIKERVRRAAAVMGQAWGIGKRRFRNDWGRRIWLFDRLVWTVLSYGVEIWGWKERKQIERLEERFLKWILGVEGSTPSYMVREELQRDKLRGRGARRARAYEKRIEEGSGSELGRECWKEIKKREGKATVGWEKERIDLLQSGRIEGERVILEEKGEENWFNRIIERDIERQRNERKKKITESRYNRWYKEIKGEGIPEYLKKGWGEKRWRRVARFRLGNEMREGRYWEEEENRLCRLCGAEMETWEHVWERCRRWREEDSSWQEVAGTILGEDGGGEEWMKEVEREREREG